MVHSPWIIIRKTIIIIDISIAICWGCVLFGNHKYFPIRLINFLPPPDLLFPPLYTAAPLPPFTSSALAPRYPLYPPRITLGGVGVSEAEALREALTRNNTIFATNTNLSTSWCCCTSSTDTSSSSSLSRNVAHSWTAATGAVSATALKL